MAYHDNARRQRQIKVGQCLSEIEKFDKREDILNRQLYEYESILSDYTKEIEAGQMSVLDYITVLRNRMQTVRDYLLVHTNRQIAIAAYNYWNN